MTKEQVLELGGLAAECAAEPASWWGEFAGEWQRRQALARFYEVPLAGHKHGITGFRITPNPFGDPHTVKCMLIGGPEGAWVILPRSLFSDEVNERV